MPYSNIHNLPPAVFAAMSKNRYVPGEKTDISVTALIDSPRIRQLVKKHGRGSTDIMDTTAAFIGTAGHDFLEEGGREVGAMVEKRFYGDYGALDGNDCIVLSGQIDCFYLEHRILDDYKFVKSWKFTMDDWESVEAQLNVCAELMRRNGYVVDEIRAVAFILDWMDGATMREGYPQQPIIVKTMKLWTREFVQEYIESRLKAHAEDMPECSSKEMWARGEAWAVMKKGRKSALKVESAKSDAAYWALENGYAEPDAAGSVKLHSGIYIEHRKPKYVRCEKFCPVAEYCSQYQDLKD